MIHLLFTGGTISMQRDEAAGGNVPTHGGDALVGYAPELEGIAPFRVEDWGKYPACHLDRDRLWGLRERVREISQTGGLEAGPPEGIVVTHGTDLIEETAYLLARTLDPAIPVVITGAMRTSSDAEWDGPGNLTDAARVAASPASRGRGTMVVFRRRIFAGHEVCKTHTVALEAFSAPHASPIGEVSGGVVRFSRPPLPPTRLEPPRLSARIALVPAAIGDQGEVLDAIMHGHDGVVLMAFGSGNLPPGMVPAIDRWLAGGKPVVLASRCPTGQVTPVYAFPGGGATLVRRGVTPAGPRTAAQARMELTIAHSAGTPYAAGERA